MFFNRQKMKNWYIMLPMKIPKRQFYDFCMKFDICIYFTRRNFLIFCLWEEGKKIWIFAGFFDYTKNSLWKRPWDFRAHEKHGQNKQ